MNYKRQLEDKTRLTINGKRYRVGNPNHPHYELYKKHGIDAVLEVMGLIEDKQQGTFPWISMYSLCTRWFDSLRHNRELT